jgi:hypothetical protein
MLFTVSLTLRYRKRKRGQNVEQRIIIFLWHVRQKMFGTSLPFKGGFDGMKHAF